MIATLAAAVLVLAGPKVDLSVGAGGHSNPFELPDDPAAAGAYSRPAPGAFVPIEADAEWRTRPRRMFRAGVDSWFDGWFFTFLAQDAAAPDRTRARDANRWTGEIALPLVFDPRAGRRGTLEVELTAEPFVGMHRETLTSHRNGRPLLFADEQENGTEDVIIDLSRRYDTNEMGVRADGDFEIGRQIDVVAGGRFTSVDYVEDYEASEHLDSWDYDELRADIHGYFRPGDWSFTASYAWRARSYDARFPRDASGEKVEDDMPGYEPQVFTYHDVVVRGGYVTRTARAVARLRNTRRIDEFRGYQSYSETALSGDVRFARNGSELRFEPGYSVRTYDELRVAYDPQEPTSNRRRLSLDLAYEWPALSSWTRLFVSAGLVSQASANPLYEYTELKAMTGVRAEWR